MNKFICVLAVILLTACSSGFNTSQCFLAVKNHYPDAEVSMLPKNDYRFLVRKSNGEVLIAETMGSEAKVTKEVIVFAARK